MRTFFGALPKQLYEFFTKFGISIQKVPQGVLYSGIPVKVGDDVYALIKDGKELFRGTKKEIDELADKLKKMSDKEAKEFVDAIINRRNALTKWANKFDDFFRHFDGEIAIKKFSVRNNTPTLWLEGAHNYLVNGTKIVIGKIRKPPAPARIPSRGNTLYKQMN